MSTYAFDRNKNSFDGSTVEDALDYYVPEWRHRDGRVLELARGQTDDGRRFFIAIDVARTSVTRYEIDEQGSWDWVASVASTMMKKRVLFLSRPGDSYDETTDKRLLIMLKDVSRVRV